MLSRIAADSEDVKPFAWLTLASAALPPAVRGANPEAAPGEVADLQKRIADLERQRQTEVAQVKLAAFEEGKQKAKQEGAAEIAAALDRLAQKLPEVAGLRTRIYKQSEADIVKLALAVARRILHRELTTDPETIQGLVHAALQRIQNRDISKVRVYPAGADALKASLARLGAAPAIQVQTDPTLKLGDLLFETSLGELDASVGTQLQEVERGLADRLLR